MKNRNLINFQIEEESIHQIYFYVDDIMYGEKHLYGS